jgi:hypothetical protein
MLLGQLVVAVAEISLGFFLFFIRRARCSVAVALTHCGLWAVARVGYFRVASDREWSDGHGRPDIAPSGTCDFVAH